MSAIEYPAKRNNIVPTIIEDWALKAVDKKLDTTTRERYAHNLEVVIDFCEKALKASRRR